MTAQTATALPLYYRNDEIDEPQRFEWWGALPSTGDAVFISHDPRPVRVLGAAGPWSVTLWPGWEDCRSISHGGLCGCCGPTFTTREEAAAHLDRLARARYGDRWAGVSFQHGPDCR